MSDQHDDLWIETPVLGALSPEEAAVKLREVGEEDAARLLEEGLSIETRGSDPASRPSLWRWPFQDRPWQYTAHTLGYIAATPPGNEVQSIVYAGNIQADESLKKSQIKITLNQLRVADYPGGGEHQILFEFSAWNQMSTSIPENVHFNIYLRAREGQTAAVIGLPIFLGLNVGTEGVTLKCQTINIKNYDDERMLEFMESEIFRTGLQLLQTAQPAVAMLSKMTAGITQALLKRSRNVKVQEFLLGLHFGNVPMSTRLAEGTYVVVQIPDTFREQWDWSEWIYKPGTGNIVSAEDQVTMVPFNYVVFGISRYG